MTDLSLRFNGYVVRHRLMVGLTLLAVAIVGTIVSSHGVSFREVLARIPF
jgi:hypothetical protein